MAQRRCPRPPRLRDVAGDPVGDAPYPATINDGNWRLAYPFRQAQVAGTYSLDVWAEDSLGNRTTLPTRSLALDGARPGMTLNEAASGLPLNQNDFRLITTTTVLQGWLADHPPPVAAMPTASRRPPRSSAASGAPSTT
ncbi:MAG: hypothetical protein R2873_30530 [Caldilineaceae bacterium]